MRLSYHRERGEKKTSKEKKKKKKLPKWTLLSEKKEEKRKSASDTERRFKPATEGDKPEGKTAYNCRGEKEDYLREKKLSLENPVNRCQNLTL